MDRKVWDKLEELTRPYLPAWYESSSVRKDDPWGGGIRDFDMLPAAVAAQCLEIAPECADEQQNYSPTASALVEQATPGGFLQGYLVSFDREDRRISFDGVMYEVEGIGGALEAANQGADEVSHVEIDGKDFVRLWWD